MQTVEQIAVEFVKRLRQNCGSDSAYQLRRFSSNNYKQANFRTKLAYLAVSEGGLKINNDVGYAVSVVYVMGHQSPECANGKMKFQTLLSELYNSSYQSTKREIESFLSIQMDSLMFWQRFFRLLNMSKIDAKMIDCIELMKDLLQWDNKTRLKWAETIYTNRKDI